MPYADSNGISIGGVSGDKSFVFLDLPPGGWGGTSKHDGMNATYCRQGNCMDLDIELAEILYPIRITRKELIQDSGGPGEFRGGLSLRVGFSPTEIDVAVSHTTNRTKEGPPGIFGGRHGRPGRSIKDYDREDSRIVGGWSEDGSWRICMFANLPVKEGEDITLELQGGGGWGDSLTRDPQKVLEDVLDGYVSLEAAEKDYSVIIDPMTMTVDIEKTLARRKPSSLNQS
jgi:N-methylhydantoinase B